MESCDHPGTAGARSASGGGSHASSERHGEMGVRRGRGRGRALRAILVAGLAGLGLAGLGPMAGIASAGEYHVYSCRTPSGEVAPTDGWTGSVPNGASNDYAEDSCAKGGALVAALGDQTTHAVATDRATWMFSAPAGDRIKEATLWRAGDADGVLVSGTYYHFWLAGPGEVEDPSDTFDQCVTGPHCPPPGVGNPNQPLSLSNLLSVPAE